MLFIQTGDCAFHAVADLLVGSYSGFTTNALSGVRNIVNTKGKMTRSLTAVFALLILVIGLISLFLSEQISSLLTTENGNPGISYYLLQLLPPIASVQYTIWSAAAKSAQRLRVGLLINLTLWLSHDIGMQLYPSLIMDTVIVAVTTINIFRNKEKKE